MKWKPGGKGMERCHFKIRSMIFLHTTYNFNIQTPAVIVLTSKLALSLRKKRIKKA